MSLGSLVLAVVVVGQAAAAVVSADSAQHIVRALLNGVNAVAIAIAVLVARKMWEFLQGLSRRVDEVLAEVRSLTQDVRGIDGHNGLRGDVRGLKRGFSRHDRELQVICDRMDVARAEDP